MKRVSEEIQPLLDVFKPLVHKLSILFIIYLFLCGNSRSPWGEGYLEPAVVLGIGEVIVAERSRSVDRCSRDCRRRCLGLSGICTVEMLRLSATGRFNLGGSEKPCKQGNSYWSNVLEAKILESFRLVGLHTTAQGQDGITDSLGLCHIRVDQGTE